MCIRDSSLTGPSWKLPICHVFLNLFELRTSIYPNYFKVIHLLPVLSPGGVEGLDEAGGVSKEHGVAGGPRHHAEDGQPQVRQVLWRESAVADAEHVGHRLEQRPRVLLEPPLVL